MASDPQRSRLPFEPGKKRKKSKPSPPPPTGESKPQPSGKRKDEPTSQAATGSSSSDARSNSKAIPEAVSRRMIARVALFSGTPTLLGVLTLVGSYFAVSQAWFPLPNVAVLLVSMGCFGLGVIGVSYGVLSASWDEDRKGTALGMEEFQTNFGRLREAWRSARSND